MSNDTITTLTTLLPSTPYLLAYALPLLLFSLLLTFTGAFLTLDRSRSFPPRYDAIPGAFHQQQFKFHWHLEGGIGGLGAGYAFGIHFSTFLALLIPAVSTSAPLTSKSFLAVWLLSVIPTTFLGGRWKYAALAFSAISAGALFPLSVSVLIHPSLLTRIVLVAVFLPILTVIIFLPIARIQHAVLRFATTSTGAFGLILSIALLSHIPAWANVWERLWLSNGAEWGTSKEKGLSAGFSFFVCFGVLAQILLTRFFGECPDEKWDNHLANYTANLPNRPDRAGTFQPLTSFWDRLFHRTATTHDDLLFPPTTTDIKSTPPSPSLPFKHTINYHTPSPAFLQTGQSRSHKHTTKPFQFHFGGLGRKHRQTPKFQPKDDVLLDSDDEGDNNSNFDTADINHSGTRNVRPWLLANQKASLMSSSSSTPTLVGEPKKFVIDYDAELAMLNRAKRKSDGPNTPDYSDYEEDLTSTNVYHQHPKQAGAGSSKGGGDWSPEFLKRYRSQSQSRSQSIDSGTYGSHSQPHKSVISPSLDRLSPMPPPGIAVPATPSLIKAFDRIAIAQKEAYGAVSASTLGGAVGAEGLPAPGSQSVQLSEVGSGPSAARKGYSTPAWDGFWKEVEERAKV